MSKPKLRLKVGANLGVDRFEHYRITTVPMPPLFDEKPTTEAGFFVTAELDGNQHCSFKTDLVEHDGRECFEHTPREIMGCARFYFTEIQSSVENHGLEYVLARLTAGELWKISAHESFVHGIFITDSLRGFYEKQRYRFTTVAADLRFLYGNLLAWKKIDRAGA